MDKPLDKVEYVDRTDEHSKIVQCFDIKSENIFQSESDSFSVPVNLHNDDCDKTIVQQNTEYEVTNPKIILLSTDYLKADADLTNIEAASISFENIESNKLIFEKDLENFNSDKVFKKIEEPFEIVPPEKDIEEISSSSDSEANISSENERKKHAYNIGTVTRQRSISTISLNKITKPEEVLESPSKSKLFQR